MAKMGISTVQSYRGAQIFEAVGLNQRGRGQIFHLDAVAHRRRRAGRDRARKPSQRHRRGVPARTVERAKLEPGGQYQWRDSGEQHLFNPQTIHKLQTACALGQREGLPRIRRS
jgi:glutamate synthase (ferredoxin)